MNRPQQRTGILLVLVNQSSFSMSTKTKKSSSLDLSAKNEREDLLLLIQASSCSVALVPWTERRWFRGTSIRGVVPVAQNSRDTEGLVYTAADGERDSVSQVPSSPRSSASARVRSSVAIEGAGSSRNA